MPNPTVTLAGPAARLALGALAVAIGVLGALEWIVSAGVPGTPPLTVGLFPICAWVYAAVGLVTWVRRPANFIGPLLVMGSLALLVADLGNLPQPVPQALGLVFGTVPLAVLVHLVHGFPTGRLVGRPSRWTVVTAYVMATVLQFPRYAFGPPSPVQIADRPEIATGALWVQRGLGIAVFGATVVVLVRRLAAATPAQRRGLAPLYAYGLVAIPFVPVVPLLLARTEPILSFQIQIGLLTGLPLALLATVGAGGFARTGGAARLSTWLSAPAPDHRAIVAGLAGTIGDRDVRLVYWAQAIGAYVDETGARVEVPPGRAVVELDLDGRPIGAILYDAAVVGERRLVEEAGTVLALAIDRERLAADLRASEDDLRGSRARIARAADVERRRIARDLHDGLQTKMVLLALAAHDAQSEPGRLADLRRGVDEVIAELRSVVDGVMPAGLTERGLTSAVDALLSRVPLLVHAEVDLPARRFPPEVETGAYFVASEAITNVLKHARATAVRVRLAVAEGWLVVEVSDDGIGGAEPVDGGGLAGLVDRVEALDGVLSVEDRPGGGTVVRAVLPCAS
jgi:signal transduction histidine kinase